MLGLQARNVNKSAGKITPTDRTALFISKLVKFQQQTVCVSLHM